ncbi:MAG TPA: xanthine dehydrogenase molybdopterin binding subunit [Flavobacteriales bacterium]|nr:xanthine dehydrogenase molybdopterin binding subunit [Flavobacteriales bacterium]HIO66871.1 xanthine dehydrogenase molybdopterin binding subunit [Flavobacteriales bacterium]
MATEHESAKYHVTGEAIYVDDMQVSEQLLYGKVVYSPHAHARILSYDINKALTIDGVHAILTYKDIPGENQMGPVFHDEVVLAEDEVIFIGQAIFLIAAENKDIAEEAAKTIIIKYEVLPHVVTMEDAMKSGRLVQPQRKIENGNVDAARQEAANILNGELKTGAQEQWYLETQVALAHPGEGQELKVYSSTQHPSETQALIAEVLDIHKMEVEVEIRRMGGAFGGKETQANHTAIWASLLAVKTGKPVKICLGRDDDQIMTGKRHRFLMRYEAGFTDDGLITYMDVEQNADAGSSTDLSMAILERAMMHAENAYYVPNIRIIGNAWFTNLPSNTAFRGFGGPQGMVVIEEIIDRIARKLGKDARELRKLNFYGIDERNEAPYGQIVENTLLHTLYDQLLETSEYEKRREEINAFNAENEFIKRGMALSPVKFGISFTTSLLNQAGALAHIYKDGSVLINHGGTEMGQGLHTKIKDLAADELGLDPEQVKVNATSTAKVPNTSATAASAGADLNGMAVKNALDKLKRRIANSICDDFNKESTVQSKPEEIEFKGGKVFDSSNTDRSMDFAESIMKAYLNQVSLSATGYYKTPDIHFDREIGKGQPYYYYAYSMAVTEVEVDTLTGHYTNIRTDILHDVGNSLNTRVDIGQIEGGYIQGVGWCTTEECKWDKNGNLLNYSPDTYKIPNIQDIPKDFRINLLEGHPNGAKTIRRSKAVGEPPLMGALSCWLAIKDAVSAAGNHQIEPDFSLPATNEVILLSLDKIHRKLKSSE